MIILQRRASAAPEVCSGASEQRKSAFVTLEAPTDMLSSQCVQPVHCFGPPGVEARLQAAEVVASGKFGRTNIRPSSSLITSLEYDPDKVSGLNSATDPFLDNQEWGRNPRFYTLPPHIRQSEAGSTPN